MTTEPCEYRVPLATPDVYFCRHTLVHAKDSVVPAVVCVGCPWASVHCPQPRDVPDTLPLVAPAPPKVPPLYKRLANFTVAAIAHELRGAPTCSQEQIDQRLAICQACPLFKPSQDDRSKGVCTHEKCGCSAGREAKYLNKLAWADQQCPLGNWPSLGNEV